MPEAHTHIYHSHNPPSQRNLNNAFAYDLVPSPTVIVAALKAARRVNDFPTAVRIFEGVHKLLPGVIRTYMCNTNKKQLTDLARIILCRNQTQSRKQTPIPRLPRRAQRSARRTGRQSEGRPVPRRNGQSVLQSIVTFSSYSRWKQR